MTLNYPDYFFTWSQFLMIFLVAGSCLPTAALIFKANRAGFDETKQIMLFTQILSKVLLDVALIVGICGTCIGLLSLMSEFESVGDTYNSVTYILFPMVYGAGITGLGFCLKNTDFNETIDFKLSNTEVVRVVLIFISLVIAHAYINSFPLALFFEAGWTYGFHLAFFLGWSVIAIFFAKRDIFAVLVDANITATLVSIGLGILFWFADGANFETSKTNIFIIARLLFFGTFIHIIFYFLSLSKSGSGFDGNNFTSWHFAEAATFFIFLVLAPVGLTEYLREDADQTAIQQQHRAQQIEIEQLERQIEVLLEAQKSAE